MKTLNMKTLIAATALAATTAVMTLPTPAAAIGVYVGPRGGVGIGLGRPGYRYGYGPRVYNRFRGPGFRRGFRRF